MGQIQPRERKGIPTGGRFDTKRHSEAEVDLSSPLDAPSAIPETQADLFEVSVSGAEWGEVTVGEGSRTPWGTAQWVEHPAPGIAVVSTAGHGGVKLSRERNRAIPKGLRAKDGWYEEDVASQIVGWVHPDAFPHASDHDFEGTVRDWFPDGYEEATGHRVTADQSRVRAEDEWTKQHHGEMVAVSAIRIEGDRNNVAVTVRPLGVAGAQSTVLKVPEATYRNPAMKHPHGRFEGRWISSGGFEEITPDPEPPPATFSGVNTSGLSASGRERLDRDLSQRWRGSDGRVRTLQDVIEGDGLTDKTVILEGGKRSFYLMAPDHSAFKVSKATWDAVEAPDLRSPQSRANTEYQYQQSALERLERTWAPRDEIDRARKRVAAAKAKYTKLREQAQDA